MLARHPARASSRRLHGSCGALGAVKPTYYACKLRHSAQAEHRDPTPSSLLCSIGTLAPPAVSVVGSVRVSDSRSVLARGGSGGAGAGTSAQGADESFTLELPIGSLHIRPILADEVRAASVVLTRAFAGSAEAVSLDDVLKDIEGMLAEKEHGVFLVGRLRPNDTSLLPPGQETRLVGTACVALSSSAQCIKRLPPVHPPPPDSGYVCNMAVDPRFRRMGVARALLAACEARARAGGKPTTSLHVREADAGARALYGGSGYAEVAQDGWMDSMRHKLKPRILMRKAL